jgi:hypothetical protein
MILCSGLSALFPFSAIAASSVTLAWSPSPGTNIAGYKVFCGGASRAYTNTINVGNVTNATISGLISGTVYYFAATAYDSSALESDYSTEAVFTNVTATPPIIVLSSPANGASYAAPAAVNLAAAVTANGHTITKVRFYNGAILLAEDTAAPYGFSWTNVSAGNYSLTAQATYDSGSTVASALANVMVAAGKPQDTPPAISAIADLAMTTNSTQRLVRFLISDAATAASNLTLYASSTNPALLPTNNIVFAGSDTNRTITLTPRSGLTGEVDITITVSDGSVTTNATFHLSITEKVAWTLLLQSSGGCLAQWSMSGADLVSGTFLEPANVGPDWRMVGASALSGNGQKDFIFQHSSGLLAYWQMSSNTCTGGGYLNPSRVDPSWRIVGTGDFNGTGENDILLQHASGLLAVWYLQGTNVTAGEFLSPSLRDPAWKAVATGDFDGDGKTDILLQHTSGRLACWLMNGSNCRTGVFLNPSLPDPSWQIVGTGDFDGDGKTDILLQHTFGWLAIWYMDGTNLVGGEFLNPTRIDPSWRIVGAR